MNYKKASAAELIGMLHEQGRHPDLKLIQALLKRGTEVVPGLIEIVEEDTGWAQVHAALLLCELRAEAALPALQRAIRAPEGEDLADWLADDALEKFGPPALDLLEAVAADKALAWYPRAVACRVMTAIAYQHPEAYDRVTAFLRSLLPDPTNKRQALDRSTDGTQVWTVAVSRLCDLRDPDAYDLTGQLFEAGLIDETVIDRESYEQAYQRRGPPAGFKGGPEPLIRRYKRSRPRGRRG